MQNINVERRMYMTIELYNLSEKELQDLRDLENKYPNEFMLKITKKAFDGHEMAKMFIETIEVIVPIIELILLWKEIRDKCKKDDEITKNAVNNIKIVANHPDGTKYSIEMENASQEALNAVLHTYNQTEEV